MSEEYTPQPEPTQTVYITETAPPNLVKGAIGALLGSLIGGAIWGGICIGTENGGGGLRRHWRGCLGRNWGE